MLTSKNQDVFLLCCTSGFMGKHASITLYLVYYNNLWSENCRHRINRRTAGDLGLTIRGTWRDQSKADKGNSKIKIIYEQVWRLPYKL